MTLGRSCATNLLSAFEHWTNWLDQGYGVDIIYLDFKKAFDSVDHVKLIEKLQNCNVDSKLIKWIAAFLQDRKMKVKVKLQFSDWVYSCSEWSTSGLCLGTSAVLDFCQRFAVMNPEQYDTAVC